MHPTCDPSLKSFVEVTEQSPFPIQNLPFGVFRPLAGGEARVGTAIGDQVVDLGALEEAGKFSGAELQGRRVFRQDALNELMALGRPPGWRRGPGSANCCGRITPNCVMTQTCGSVYFFLPTRSGWSCPHASGITRTSIPAANTPPTWGSCSGARTTP